MKGLVSDVHVPLTSLFGLVLALGAFVTAGAMSTEPARTTLPAALVPAGALLAVCTFAEERLPLVFSKGYDLSRLFRDTPLLLAACTVAGILGGVVAARPRRTIPPANLSSRPLVRFATYAALILTAAGVLAAIPRFIREPSPERYITALPVVGRLDALPASEGLLDCEHRHDVVEQSAAVGAIRIRRSNNRCGCGVSLANGVDPSMPDLSFMTWYEVDLGPAPYSRCGQLDVRVDPAHAFVLVDDGHPFGRRAYRYVPEKLGPLDEVIDVTPMDVVDATGPSGWRVGGESSPRSRGC